MCTIDNVSTTALFGKGRVRQGKNAHAVHAATTATYPNAVGLQWLRRRRRVVVVIVTTNRHLIGNVMIPSAVVVSLASKGPNIVLRLTEHPISVGTNELVTTVKAGKIL